jgi:hypothetical protein
MYNEDELIYWLLVMKKLFFECLMKDVKGEVKHEVNVVELRVLLLVLLDEKDESVQYLESK